MLDSKLSRFIALCIFRNYRQTTQHIISAFPKAPLPSVPSAFRTTVVVPKYAVRAYYCSIGTRKVGRLVLWLPCRTFSLALCSCVWRHNFKMWRTAFSWRAWSCPIGWQIRNFPCMYVCMYEWMYVCMCVYLFIYMVYCLSHYNGNTTSFTIL